MDQESKAEEKNVLGIEPGWIDWLIESERMRERERMSLRRKREKERGEKGRRKGILIKSQTKASLAGATPDMCLVPNSKGLVCKDVAIISLLIVYLSSQVPSYNTLSVPT